MLSELTQKVLLWQCQHCPLVTSCMDSSKLTPALSWMVDFQVFCSFLEQVVKCINVPWTMEINQINEINENENMTLFHENVIRSNMTLLWMLSNQKNYFTSAFWQACLSSDTWGAAIDTSQREKETKNTKGKDVTLLVWQQKSMGDS